MIKDTFNRVHDYLRISLTDNCNLRCFYCMPDEDHHFTPAAKLIQADELETIARAFVSQGVKKIRLTGGEPLVRKDAREILTALGQLPVQLTMTSNGTRVHEFIPVLEAAGIRSLNISLDTLDADKFLLLTRRNLFRQVMDNIELLMDRGFHVKVNMVVMKDVNSHEINNFIAWTRHRPVHVRFIEFMPFSGNRWTSNKVFSLHEILTVAAQQYSFTPLKSEPNDTAKSFRANGHAGTFAIISTMTAPFCNTCNRMRLTADGKLKNCLFSAHETDLLTALRNGEDIIPLIHQNISSKAKQLGGQLTTDFEHIETSALQNRSMISIGG